MPSSIETALHSKIQGEQAWTSFAKERCKLQLANASSSADQAALVREWVRLHGDSASAPPEVTLSEELVELLRARFGVHTSPTDSGQTCFILDSDLTTRFTAELPRALRVDLTNRRPPARVTADAMLRRLTKHDTYNNLTQKAAVRALVTMPPGGTLIVTLATGGGKSLLFQLGTLWWREQAEPTDIPCSIVIVPTVALAIDHERTVRAIPGLEKCRALTGSLSTEEREEILVKFGSGEVPILFCSPEILLGRAFKFFLECAKPCSSKVGAFRARLRGVFVDEAHVIESWGRRFRPDFQRLPGLVAELRSRNPQIQVVLLSATLGEQASAHLRQAYVSGPILEISAQVPRTEFDVFFQEFNEHDRDLAVLELVDRVPRPAIIYTTEVEHARSIYQQLKQRQYSRLALFTGETPDSERQKIIDAWADDGVDMVVATSAFGMGIDKANVRSVIHACLPENAARYYQEIGRGGRDGYQTLAFCAWTRRDVAAVRRQINSEWLTTEVAEDRWQGLLARAESLGGVDFANKTIALPLDASRKALLHTHTGERNRDWNAALLTFLQRRRVLDVLISENALQYSNTWTVRILEAKFLDAVQYRAQIFATREQERLAALEELDQLFHVVLGKTDLCLFCSLYELVEAGQPLIEPCGRCSVCRTGNLPAPLSLDFKGGLQLWRVGPSTASERVLIHPDDPTFSDGLDVLLQRLVEHGVEQFAVPDEVAPNAANILAFLNCNLGLTIELSSLTKQSWKLSSHLKTALILNGQTSVRIDAVMKDAYEQIHQLFIIAPPSQLWKNKPLIHSMTIPVYAESYLARDRSTVE